MITAATPQQNPSELVLCLAFETGVSEWKIAFSTGLGQRPRLRDGNASRGRAREGVE